MDIGRLHALDDRRSLQIGVDRLAHQRTRAVAADDEVGMNLRGGSGVEIADGRNDAVIALAEILERGAVQNLKPVDGAACANSTGSMWIWLMRCGGSAVGQSVSGPPVAV